MKRIARLSYFLLMASMGLQAHDHDHPSRPGHPDREVPFATSAFESDDDDDDDNIVDAADEPYDVETNEEDYVDLSQYGNVLVSEGNIEANPFGIEIEEDGDYFVAFSAILENEDGDPLTLEVVLDNIFEDIVSYPVPAVRTIDTFWDEHVKTVENVGFLKDLKRGTLLTLKARNIDGGEDRDISVLGWTISAEKINAHRRHDDNK